LGVSRSTLRKKLDRYNISPDWIFLPD
jgi:hypothetical protein